MESPQNNLVFVSASSHRARARLYSRFPKAISFYKNLSSKVNGPHYVYAVSLEESNSLKDRPIKGCGKIRCQDPEEYSPCISWGVGIK